MYSLFELHKPTLPTKSIYKVFVGKVGLIQEGYIYVHTLFLPFLVTLNDATYFVLYCLVL